MKEEFTVKCEARENASSNRLGILKSSRENLKGDAAAIEYAANFLKGLNAENYVYILFKENVRTIDACSIKGTVADVENTLKIMANAYETAEEIQKVEVKEANIAEKKVENKALVVGKTYVAYKFHRGEILNTFKAQIIHFTEKTATVEVWENKINRKFTFKNCRILLGGSGDVLDQNVEYFSVYDEELCSERLFCEVPAEYAVSVEAQEVALQAEIDIAASKKAKGIETVDAINVENVIAKFEVGKVYPLHDICYTVIKRTENYVTLKHQTVMSAVMGYYKEEVTKKTVKQDDAGNEVVYGISAFGRLEAAVDLETYERRFNCKLTEEGFVSYNWSDENTVDVKLEIVENETDGSEDDPDEEENIDYNFEESDLKDAYGEWKERVKPYTYHVLALNVKGNLTFDGKRISIATAASEIARARNLRSNENYKYRHEMLLSDKNAYEYLRRRYCYMWESENLKFVDFGRDEIPYINRKVEKILDWYKNCAEIEETEKAREAAYKASLEYKLDELNSDIEVIVSEISRQKTRIRSKHIDIIRFFKYIAETEDAILEIGLKLDELNVEKSAIQARAKKIKDEIATQNAYKVINEAAVNSADDGSNEEAAEENTIDYNFGFEEEDDELIDEAEESMTAILKTLTKAAMEEYVKRASKIEELAPVNFDLQQFNSAVNIAESPATIDTAVSLTETPLIDNTEEIETALHNIQAFKKSIKANQKRIKHFENEIYKAELIIKESRDGIKWAQKTMRKLEGYIAECESDLREFRPMDYWEQIADRLTAEFNKIPYKNSSEELMKIIGQDGTKHSLPCNFGDLEMREHKGKMFVALNGYLLASYLNGKSLEKAITGLMDAIKRGDKEFTLNVDETDK